MTRPDRQPDVVISGRFERGEERRYVHLPFTVPAGVRQVHLRYDYNDRISSDPVLEGGNTLDAGLFDEQGIASGGPGFRGWSGSERLAFTIDEHWATPPYRSGPIGAGVWHVLLGPYKIGPRGLDYRVEIWFNAGLPPEVPEIVLREPRMRAQVPAAAEPGWVRGDLHCHSLYSDGDSWPSELLVRAAELGLDFLAITDHNSAQFPKRPDDPPGLPFLLHGIEVTTYGGHWNVWGLREWFDFRDPTAAGVAAEMRRAIAAGGFVSINHPRPWGPDWHYEGIEVNHAVEVWNGPWDHLNPVCAAFWEDQISRGRRVVAVGGSDTHELRGAGEGLLPPPKLAEPTTWIHVGPRLDAASLLAGLRAGRCFVSASPRGPQLYCRKIEGGMTVRVVGGDGAKLEVLAGATVIAERAVMGGDWSETVEIAEQAPYVRAQVVNEKGNVLAFANPMWADGHE
ncbi:MAG TPA: CehA/McbA family metallohydrolase [Thermomicrobiales bacterium]|jgi:hypothetical protein